VSGGATGTGAEVAAALRAQWRMIESVSLRPGPEGQGFEAELRLDPIVVKGSFEQQGYPRTPEAMTRAEARRRQALAACVERVNALLPSAERITGFTVTG
jgi:hypothetical protein